MVDIFRPENAGDTLKLFLNWDGMGKLMLDSLVDADNRGTILQAGLFLYKKGDFRLAWRHEILLQIARKIRFDWSINRSSIVLIFL